MVLLAGGTFHNNYMPWASVWVVLAIIEGASEERPRRAPPLAKKLAEARH
jgi:hypothetical protein